MDHMSNVIEWRTQYFVPSMIQRLQRPKFSASPIGLQTLQTACNDAPISLDDGFSRPTSSRAVPVPGDDVKAAVHVGKQAELQRWPESHASQSACVGLREQSANGAGPPPVPAAASKTAVSPSRHLRQATHMAGGTRSSVRQR